MTPCDRLLLDRLETPLGTFVLVADDGHRLRAAGFEGRHARMEAELRAVTRGGTISLVPASDPGGITSAVARYFAGDVAAIDTLPVLLDGTPFQKSVWDALRLIPAGETWSYGRLARHLGRPKAVRAVGLANGANPVAIVVPCHRVIGSDGTLTGYGGGLDRKRWLLAHEAAAFADAARHVPLGAWAEAATPA